MDRRVILRSRGAPRAKRGATQTPHHFEVVRDGWLTTMGPRQGSRLGQSSGPDPGLGLGPGPKGRGPPFMKRPLPEHCGIPNEIHRGSRSCPTDESCSSVLDPGKSLKD